MNFFIIIIFVGFYFFPQETRLSLSGTVQNLHSEGRGRLALSKGDGEQWARVPPNPPHQPPAVPGKAGGLAQSSTQGWGGGRHMGAAGATPAAPAHPAGGARRDRDIPMMCFLEWLFFFFSFLFFFPLFFQSSPAPGFWQQPANWIHHQPSAKGSLGSAASPQSWRWGGWAPLRWGIPAGPGQSRAPRAASVELDFIHQAECLQPGKAGGGCRLCQE